MVQNKSGLIVTISSVGGWQYLFNVPYTVGKSACDRMAADCAFELKKENVAMVSLWPGAAKTEYIQENVKDTSNFFQILKKSGYMGKRMRVCEHFNLLYH